MRIQGIGPYVSWCTTDKGCLLSFGENVDYRQTHIYDVPANAFQIFMCGNIQFYA